MRINPNTDTAHVHLGLVLGSKGDADGEIAEYREALRLNPDNDLAHFDLGHRARAEGRRGWRDRRSIVKRCA